MSGIGQLLSAPSVSQTTGPISGPLGIFTRGGEFARREGGVGLVRSFFPSACFRESADGTGDRVFMFR